MIYTVTLNPSLDYVISATNFQIDEVNRCNTSNFLPGGKGINASIMLTNLGVENTMLGFIGGFTGEKIIQLLESNAYNYDFCRLCGQETRINVKLICEKKITEFNCTAPGITSNDMCNLYHKLDKVQQDDYIVLAGSVPKSLPNIYEEIMKHYSDRNVHFVVDTTGKDLQNTLKFRPFLIKPNQYELSELFGVTISTFEDATAYGKKLCEQGAENVIVSMGAKGAVLITNNGNSYVCEAPKGTVLNTVGSGDSTIAGFLAGITGTKNVKTAFSLAVSAGSATAFSEHIAEKDHVLQLLSTIKCTF